MKKQSVFLSIIFVFCFIFAMKNPNEICFYTKNALDLCFTRLIPSLYIFIVLTKLISDIFTNIGISEKTSNGLSTVLGISKNLLPTFFISLLCGIPTAIYGICDVYKNGRCSKTQAENASVLCSFCSASFIFGIAGSLFTDQNTATIIYISNVFATLTVYFLFFKSKVIYLSDYNIRQSNLPFGNALIKTISSVLFDMITLSSYVVFFYVLSSCIAERVVMILQKMGADYSKIAVTKSLVFSLFEMTNGVLSCSGIAGYIKITVVSFAVSFLGLSIIFQVKSILGYHGLSASKFIKSRLMCCFICPLYTLALLFVVPIAKPAFKAQNASSGKGANMKIIFILFFFTVICIMGGKLIEYMDKKHKK